MNIKKRQTAKQPNNTDNNNNTVKCSRSIVELTHSRNTLKLDCFESKSTVPTVSSDSAEI